MGRGSRSTVAAFDCAEDRAGLQTFISRTTYQFSGEFQTSRTSQPICSFNLIYHIHEEKSVLRQALTSKQGTLAGLADQSDNCESCSNKTAEKTKKLKVRIAGGLASNSGLLNTDLA